MFRRGPFDMHCRSGTPYVEELPPIDAVRRFLRQGNCADHAPTCRIPDHYVKLCGQLGVNLVYGLVSKFLGGVELTILTLMTLALQCRANKAGPSLDKQKVASNKLQARGQHGLPAAASQTGGPILEGISEPRV